MREEGEETGGKEMLETETINEGKYLKFNEALGRLHAFEVLRQVCTIIVLLIPLPFVLLVLCSSFCKREGVMRPQDSARLSHQQCKGCSGSA